MATLRWTLVLSIMLAFALSLGVATSALAQDDEDEGEIFPDDYPVVNKGFAGMNGILTWPADPVMFAVDGPEVFEDIPGAPVTSAVVGLGAGLLQAPYRAVTSLIDFSTFFLQPVMPMIGPAPRFKVVPHYHPDE